MNYKGTTVKNGGALRSMFAKVPYYPERSMMVFLSFLAFVVVRYVQIGARRDFLAAIRFEFLVGVLVIVLVSWQMSIRRPKIGNGNSLLVSISLLFLVMVVQLPFAADPIVARMIFMDRVIKFAFLTFFMVVMIESPKKLHWFLISFLFSIFYITLEAVEGLVSGSLLWQNQGVMRLHGAVGIYRHPNSLGGVAMGALPYTAFLFNRFDGKILKLGLLAVSVTSSICVLYSGSRTAYVGLLAFVLWWFFQAEKKGKFLIWGLIFGAIGLSIIPAEYIERFESIGGQEKEWHSKDTRKVIMRDAITILMENPLGVGVASFPAVRKVRFGRDQDTHNLYLEVATNLGWQGLFVFLGLLAIVMASLRRSAFGFRAQLSQLGRAARTPGLPLPIRSRFAAHIRDLEYLVATAQATGGFILVRMVLGLFGMDLYEVYWWFGAGLTLVLSGFVVSTGRNTKLLLEFVREFRE